MDIPLGKSTILTGIFHTAGAAKTLTASYVASDVLPLNYYNFVLLEILYTIGTGGTGWELKVEYSNDGTNWYEAASTITGTAKDFSIQPTFGFDFMKVSAKENGSPSPFGTLLLKARLMTLKTADDFGGSDVDGTAFTVATNKGQVIMGVATPGDSVDSGDKGAFAMTVDRKIITAGYDSSEDAINMKEVDPLSAHRLGPTIADASSQGDGTTYYYIDMDTRRGCTIHGVDTPGVAGDQVYTLEMSLLDDGTPQASCPYKDITQFGGTNGLAAAAANFTTDFIWALKAEFNCKYLRVKVVRANDGANTDGAWVIMVKKWY